MMLGRQNISETSAPFRDSTSINIMQKALRILYYILLALGVASTSSKHPYFEDLPDVCLWSDVYMVTGCLDHVCETFIGLRGNGHVQQCHSNCSVCRVYNSTKVLGKIIALAYPRHEDAGCRYIFNMKDCSNVSNAKYVYREEIEPIATNIQSLNRNESFHSDYIQTISWPKTIDSSLSGVSSQPIEAVNIQGSTKSVIRLDHAPDESNLIYSGFMIRETIYHKPNLSIKDSSHLNLSLHPKSRLPKQTESSFLTNNSVRHSLKSPCSDFSDNNRIVMNSTVRDHLSHPLHGTTKTSYSTVLLADTLTNSPLYTRTFHYAPAEPPRLSETKPKGTISTSFYFTTHLSSTTLLSPDPSFTSVSRYPATLPVTTLPSNVPVSWHPSKTPVSPAPSVEISMVPLSTPSTVIPPTTTLQPTTPKSVPVSTSIIPPENTPSSTFLLTEEPVSSIPDNSVDNRPLSSPSVQSHASRAGSLSNSEQKSSSGVKVWKIGVAIGAVAGLMFLVICVYYSYEYQEYQEYLREPLTNSPEATTPLIQDELE